MLNNKSELEKVLAKQRTASEKKQVAEKEVENEFHKMLTERAKRLEQVLLLFKGVPTKLPLFRYFFAFTHIFL